MVSWPTIPDRFRLRYVPPIRPLRLRSYSMVVPPYLNMAATHELSCSASHQRPSPNFRARVPDQRVVMGGASLMKKIIRVFSASVSSNTARVLAIFQSWLSQETDLSSPSTPISETVRQARSAQGSIQRHTDSVPTSAASKKLAEAQRSTKLLENIAVLQLASSNLPQIRDIILQYWQTSCLTPPMSWKEIGQRCLN